MLSNNGVRTVLAVLVISNLMALPDHHRATVEGGARSSIEATPVMIRALKDLVSSNHPREQNAQRYDAWKNANPIQWNTLRVWLPGPLDTNDYLQSSHFYNFMRSEYGLPFVQE